MYVYENICLKCDGDRAENIAYNVFEPTCDTINVTKFSYTDLLVSVKEQLVSVEIPWKITFESQMYFDVSLYDKKLINGIRAFKVLQVFDNLTWVVSYAGQQASKCLFSNTFRTRFRQ